MGRHVVHDPASRAFAHTAKPPVAVGDLAERTWRHRFYNPRPVPKQLIGCCTGVDQVVKANAAGNRVKGQVLTMDTAVQLYQRATQLDPWPGQYPPEDTGSSGLAACKAAKELGLISRYEWVFGGHDALLAALWHRPVGLGTWWYSKMFYPDPKTLLVEPAGPKVGGHQWTLIGWDGSARQFDGLCWWGPDFGARGRFRISADAVAQLRADDGDAHVTYRVSTT
jgi:hypothetical protein